MRKKARPSRKQNSKKLGKRLLIVCEGEKTEPNYFVAFREDLRTILINIAIEGTGANTDSLIEETLKYKKHAAKNKEPYDEIWAVFDRDSCPAGNFNRAFDLASHSGIKIAYSNEAFEIWYLLHFDYIVSALSRSQYQAMLTQRLGFTYEKNSKGIFSHLKSLQNDAIRNAKRLLSEYLPSHPERDNPSTTVHKLVEELNKYKK
jgi:hypothetical protein